MAELHQITIEEMEEMLEGGSEPVGHICLYVGPFEIHADICGDMTDFAAFASGVGQFITAIMLEQVRKGDNECQH
jgi:hypothetical protein